MENSSDCGCEGKQTGQTALADSEREALRQVLYAEKSPVICRAAKVRTIHARRLPRRVPRRCANKIEA